MRVGLVLGAGGVMGGAWLTGGLDALARETGWDPAEADYVVGTSAGSMIGALCASGIPPWFMVAHSFGETFEGVVDANGRPASDADRSGGAAFRLHRALPSLGPGSWRLVARTLSSPMSYSPSTVITGWLPKGMISTEALKRQIRHVVPSGWSPHPNLWIIACDYATGKRVAFGREDAPDADLADAVASSCAIPGFYHPVEIGGRRYVDGGIRSTSNLDVLRGRDLDLVICLNPTSSLHPIRALNPASAFRLMMNRESGRRLGSEAKKLRAEGTEVVLVQPLHDDLAVMGNNLMSSRRRNEAIAVAQRTVGEQLRAPGVRELLADLPQGDSEKIHRPDDEVPSRWPRLRELKERIGRRGGTAAQAAISALKSG
jgi:NTE family protein